MEKADTLKTAESQSKLNRYYRALSDLGINISRLDKEIFTIAESISECLVDIEKVSKQQAKVWEYFKVDFTN